MLTIAQKRPRQISCISKGRRLWFGRGQNSSNSKSDLSSSSLLASSSPDFSEASHLSEASSFWDASHLSEASNFCEAFHLSEASSFWEASHLSEASNFWEASHLSEASNFWDASHLSEVSATFMELSDGVSFMLGSATSALPVASGPDLPPEDSSPSQSSRPPNAVPKKLPCSVGREPAIRSPTARLPAVAWRSRIDCSTLAGRGLGVFADGLPRSSVWSSRLCRSCVFMMSPGSFPYGQRQCRPIRVGRAPTRRSPEIRKQRVRLRAEWQCGPRRPPSYPASG